MTTPTVQDRHQDSLPAHTLRIAAGFRLCARLLWPQASDSARVRLRATRGSPTTSATTSADADYGQDVPPTPFELEVLEGALMVATGAPRGLGLKILTFDSITSAHAKTRDRPLSVPIRRLLAIYQYLRSV